MRILYVEDNPANLFLVKRVAKMGNHDVINYIDGEEALRKMSIIKPDLILMDIQLSGEMTGLDVVRHLRKDGYGMPIIAVTAYAMVGDKERCLEAGCDDYLAKPLPIARLVEMFEHYTKLTTTERQVVAAALAETVGGLATEVLPVTPMPNAKTEILPTDSPAKNAVEVPTVVVPVAETAKPNEIAKPAEVTPPSATEAVKPAETPAQPSESVKPAEAAKPTEAAKPAEAAKPTEVTPPPATEAAKPVETASQPSETTKPIVASTSPTESTSAGGTAADVPKVTPTEIIETPAPTAVSDVKPASVEEQPTKPTNS